MVAMTHDPHRSQGGISLIEVLIAMVILAIGLLGLVGLQGRLHVTQVESYQRAQALILLQDMTNRIALNRTDALSYVTVEPLGTGMAGGCPVANVTRVERDVREWCEFLIGASETLGGASVGAMVGGRGCVEEIDTDEYMITVAWQGLAPSVAPTDSANPDVEPCGAGLYDGPAGSPCVNDLCRRTVTTIVRISDLTPA
jgi:type IV pilus assembly protein PilV